ncbi:DUF423 domain-containing protein [Alteromonas sp. ASW11-36]|uniref:DUF423 domain-containing protein n=1 Tax=Alteromonas arenosi TaxID=3055817 RepID=A0ABT7T042_9ALTE|nr:DUF423 domain-containing protein [Alteromonas sp. ASW11-36]MDM7861182.1 DUF423 domain-containing protein [Alteromonas sp. ASW11-36]
MALNRSIGLLIIAAAVLAFIAVAMGAFAAHGLQTVLSEEQLATIRTGVLYQFIHCLAVLLCCVLLAQSMLKNQRRLICVSAWCFVLGVILFSGSLYGLVLLQLSALGPVTPVGGVLFLVGWGCLTVVGSKLLRQQMV